MAAGTVEPALQVPGVRAAVRPAVVGVLEYLVMPQQPHRGRGDVGSEERGRDVAMRDLRAQGPIPRERERARE